MKQPILSVVAQWSEKAVLFSVDGGRVVALIGSEVRVYQTMRDWREDSGLHVAFGSLAEAFEFIVATPLPAATPSVAPPPQAFPPSDECGHARKQWGQRTFPICERPIGHTGDHGIRSASGRWTYWANTGEATTA